MSVYIILYLFNFMVLVKEKLNKINKKYYICLGIVFILLTCFRDNVGIDYKTYAKTFDKLNVEIEIRNQFKYMEIGFRYIMFFIKLMIKNYIYLFMFMGIITGYIFYKGFIRESKFVGLSYFIYLCGFYLGYDYSGIRQAFTMAVLIFSVKYIVGNNRRQILFLTLLGGSVHSSGYFLAIGYLCSKINLKKRLNYLIILILLLILGKLGVFRVISLYVPKLNSYLTKYREEINSIGILQRLLLIGPFFIYFYLIEANEKFKKIFNIYFWGLLFYFIFSFEKMFSTRINMYFKILETILVPLLLFNLRKSSNKTILWLYYILIYTSIFIKEVNVTQNSYKFLSLEKIFTKELKFKEE